MTSSERSEVAERMRVYSHDFDFGNTSPFWYVAKSVFGDVNRCTYGSAFSRLADLIDPTCHLVSTTSGEGFCGTTIFNYELSCGHTCDTEWPEPPNYCYKCGAMVVDGDE